MGDGGVGSQMRECLLSNLHLFSSKQQKVLSEKYAEYKREPARGSQDSGKRRKRSRSSSSSDEEDDRRSRSRSPKRRAPRRSPEATDRDSDSKAKDSEGAA